MNAGQDLYFLLNANNEVSDGFRIEQLADIQLSAKQFVNKNNTEWKEAFQYPELQQYISQKPLPPNAEINKPLPPRVHQETNKYAEPNPITTKEVPSASQFSKNHSIESNTTDYFEFVKKTIKKYWLFILVIAGLLVWINNGKDRNDVPEENIETPNRPLPNEEIINRFLIVGLPSKDRNIDGRIYVTFRNKSDQYIFEIPDVAVRHSVPWSGEDDTVFPAVGLTLEPGQSRRVEVPFPRGCRPKIAYVLLDNITFTER